MSMINIRETSDAFERYKMPSLIAKIEGNGNGIKTVVVNMVEIARALNRPALYPTKYFGCELGAQIQVDLKNQRYIVNGAHTAERLQDLLRGFIKKYVLCNSCGNPETTLMVKKGNILAKCIACGGTCQIDAAGRFSSYLVKHPPDQTDSPAPQKRDKKQRRKEKKEQSEQNGHGSANGNGAADSGEQVDDEEDEDDDDWLEDTEEDRQQRENELSAHVRNMIIRDDDKPEEDRLEMFYSFCKELKTNGTLNSQHKLVCDRADALRVKEKATLLLMDLLVSLPTFQKNLEDYQTLFRLFTFENTRAQRNALGGMEKLVADLTETEINQRVPALMQILYMSDIVEEKGFFDWSKRASSRYVGSEKSRLIHAAAQCFLTWLKNAEEEESDEEDASPEPENENDGFQVDFSSTGKVGVVDAESPGEKKENLEDLDIDGI